MKQKIRRETGRLSELPPRIIGRAARYAFISSLMLGAVAGETAWAAQMPAGSTVWMVFDSNACDADGDANCLTSNQPGQNPPNGIPLTTFSEPNGTHATGFAEVYPGQVRSYVSSYGGAFMYISMQDTYTVHGNTSSPFSITAHLNVSGTADSIRVYNGSNYWEQLIGANVVTEIGTFNPSTASPFSEQFRVTPFNTTLNSATQLFGSESHYLGTPFSYAVDVGTSYTRSVSVGDVFDLAYGVTSALGVGALDLRDTAVISFDLPEGVYLTSSLGGTFGNPVPSPSPPPCGCSAPGCWG